MVGTLGPTVCGRQRNHKSVLIALIYILGHVTAALLLGLALYVPSLILRELFEIEFSNVAFVVASLSAIGALRDAKILRVSLPQLSWQVPRRWVHMPAFVAPLIYGLSIGSGVFVQIPFSTFYVVLAICLASGDWKVNCIVMLLYGFWRAVIVLIFTSIYTLHQNRLRCISTMGRLSPLVARISTLALSSAAGFLC
jgi:hypothetical protein